MTRSVIPFPTEDGGPRRPPAFDADKPDYQITLLQPIARYLSDQLGPQSLDAVRQAADLSPAALKTPGQWTSQDRFEAFLGAAYRLLGGEERFKQACCHELTARYAPSRPLRTVLPPTTGYRKLLRDMQSSSKRGTWHLSKQSAHTLMFAQHGPPERHLTALYRAAVFEALPHGWQLPSAEVRIETKDAQQHYHIRWDATLSVVPIVLGMLTGAMAASALVGFEIAPLSWSMLPLPLGGALLGHVVDLHATHQKNLGFNSERDLLHKTQVARSSQAQAEILGLNHRQQQWSNLVEQEVLRRTEQLRDITDHLKRLYGEDTARHPKILRAPLDILKQSIDVLNNHQGALGDQAETMIEAHKEAVLQIEALISEIMAVADAHQKLPPAQSEPIKTQALTETLGRRLRALTHGRSVRTNVVTTQDAPDVVICNQTFLDRILDTLLANAAHDRKADTIWIEVGGTEHLLTLKIFDNGPSLETQVIEHLTHPETLRAPHDATPETPLTSIVKWLAEIRGRLEVRSRIQPPGTTFWVHIPADPHRASDHSDSPELSSDASSAPIVSVRRQSNPHG